MNNILELFGYILGILICENSAQYFIKTSNEIKDYNYLYLASGCLFYSAVAYLLSLSYAKFPLSKVNVIWSSFTIIMSIILGYFLYNENINAKLLLAMSCSVVAVFLVYIA